MSTNLKVFVIGGGGREHALAWALAKSPRVAEVYVSPGNAGTGLERKCKNILLPDNAACAAFAESQGIDFTIVGPEAPLATGIVDFFCARGLAVFGPTQEAAQLESSKLFAKALMNRRGIPTAEHIFFESANAAYEHAIHCSLPIVVKADGLAGGKGAFVCSSREEVLSAVNEITVLPAGAHNCIIFEECLVGEEVSFIVMVDENGNVLPLATSQDHKRLLDGDKGPNTGGMGAISPAPVVTLALHDRIMREIIMPTVRHMAEENTPFVGFLYAGLMIDVQGNPKVLEFNCRMGDPETQPIMMRLKSDFAEIVEYALTGTLDLATAKWDSRVAVGVVLAAEGYPSKPRKGDRISDIPRPTDDCKVFHAGTKIVAGINQDAWFETSGGRVLCVTALGKNIVAAQRLANVTAKEINFRGKQYRRDIGDRACLTLAFQQGSKHTRP